MSATGSRGTPVARRVGALLPAAAFLLASCGEPEGRPVSFRGYEAVAPTEWEPGELQSSMRLAEFDAGDGAEVVVFYFGPGEGGSAEANVARWESQFTDSAGGPVAAEVSTLPGATFPTTVVELEGSYSRGIGMGSAAGGPEPDQALVAAVVEAPGGNLYPQLFGPRDAVAGRRAGFLAFVASIEAGDGP